MCKRFLLVKRGWYLLLISTFMALWSEFVLNMISVLWYLLKITLWPGACSVFKTCIYAWKVCEFSLKYSVPCKSMKFGLLIMSSTYFMSALVFLTVSDGVLLKCTTVFVDIWSKGACMFRPCSLWAPVGWEQEWGRKEYSLCLEHMAASKPVAIMLRTALAYLSSVLR